MKTFFNSFFILLDDESNDVDNHNLSILPALGHYDNMKIFGPKYTVNTNKSNSGTLNCCCGAAFPL